MKILLRPRPSLHRLRQGFVLIVRQLPWYYGAVRLLQNVRVRRSAFRLHEPVSSRWDRDAPEVSRFSCMLFLDVLGVCDHAGPCVSSRSSAAAGVAFSQTGKDRHPDLSFSRLNVPPADASVYASPTASQRPAQDSRSGWIRFSFPVE